MSDKIPEGDEKIVEEAKLDYAAYIKAFEEKFGYTIGAATEPGINKDGAITVQTVMKLVKLQIPPIVNAEMPTNPPNGNDKTTETGESDSGKQPEGQTAE